MRHLIGFFQFLTALVLTTVTGIASAIVLAVVLIPIGYGFLQLIYLIGFLYKLYIYQV